MGTSSNVVSSSLLRMSDEFYRVFIYLEAELSLGNDKAIIPKDSLRHILLT